MKLGRDIVTGLDRYLIAWKDVDDPARSEYIYRLDPVGFPQLLTKGFDRDFSVDRGMTMGLAGRQIREKTHITNFCLCSMTRSCIILLIFKRIAQLLQG